MDQSNASGQLSATTSPTAQGYPPDLFPLDFLSFIDGTSSSPSLNHGFLGGDAGTGGQQGEFQVSADSGPSSSTIPHSQPQAAQTYHLSPTMDGSSDAAGRGGSSRGRTTRTKGSNRNSISGLSHAQSQLPTRSPTQAQITSGGSGSGRMGLNAHASSVGGMEVDQDGVLLPRTEYTTQGFGDMDAFVESLGGPLTGLSQGMLQQFEGIHMQSPIVFDPSNPMQPYNPMAQYLASPAGQQAEEERRKAPTVNMVGGLITPAASGEMFPQIRMEQMSPMQLEMLARREQMEGMPDLNVLPLLSPAITHQNPGQNQPIPPQTSSGGYVKSPLEALQEQQRQFQEQLNALQVQQRQLQATAAAVAASQVSPFLAGNSNGGHSGASSGHSRPISTPNVNGSTEPSPQYFSPLTSPALEARQYHSFNGGTRPPHPLSALSSPALNPLGSSGGAQQTLSPALNPQNNAELSDPDYLRALVGMFDQQQQPLSLDTSQRMPNGQFASPSHAAVYASQPHSHQSSPITPQHGGFPPTLAPAIASTSGGTGPGPHRQSLPSKSRPSPLVKPVNHRSHMRQPSTHTSFSQPSSPAVLKGIQPGTYLPPAAIDQQRAQNISGSQASTPSPVDLTLMMPPPPVPTTQRGLTPMTPAALMNLGGNALASSSGSVGGRKPVLPKPSPQASAGEGLTSRTGANSAGQTGMASTSRAIGRRAGAGTNGNISIASAPGAAGTPPSIASKKGQKAILGKRGVAKGTGVGVRAATKAAAAAAAALIPPEGETRRTSHKAAEQKRRDSLKAGFDELRLLLPPINTEALDPESGEPLPGSSAPRLLPKSSLVPDDNPNRGVSKVALLKFSNEYIVKLHEKIDRREGYIDKLRMEVDRLRKGEDEEVRGEEGVDLLDYDFRAGEEDEDEEEGDLEEGLDGDEGEDEDFDDVERGEYQTGDNDDEMLDMDDEEQVEDTAANEFRPSTRKGIVHRNPSAVTKKTGNGLAVGTAAARRPMANRRVSSGSTVTARSRRGE